jgi:hypothetical protein
MMEHKDILIASQRHSPSQIMIQQEWIIANANMWFTYTDGGGMCSFAHAFSPTGTIREKRRTMDVSVRNWKDKLSFFILEKQINHHIA